MVQFSNGWALAMAIAIQWGFEIRPLKIQKHLKSGLFEGRISNGLYVVGFQVVPTIPNPEKNCEFSLDHFYFEINIL